MRHANSLIHTLSPALYPISNIDCDILMDAIQQRLRHSSSPNISKFFCSQVKVASDATYPKRAFVINAVGASLKDAPQLLSLSLIGFELRLYVRKLACMLPNLTELRMQDCAISGSEEADSAMATLVEHLQVQG